MVHAQESSGVDASARGSRRESIHGPRRHHRPGGLVALATAQDTNSPQTTPRMAPVAHQVGLLVPCRVAARAGAGASRSWLTEWDTQFAREVEQGRGGGQNRRLGGQPPRRPRATAPQCAYRWRPAHVVSAARAQLRGRQQFLAPTATSRSTLRRGCLGQDGGQSGCTARAKPALQSAGAAPRSKSAKHQAQHSHF